MKLLLRIAVALIPLSTLAQHSKNTGTWTTLNTKVNLGKRWSAFNELQLRSQLFYDDPYYYEVKGGLAYSLNRNFSVLLGTGKYITYADNGNFRKPLANNETRFWQQLTINHNLARIKFEHRYRIEQRWLSSGYRNRFRYRLDLDLPLNNRNLEPRTFYVSAFNEIFLTNLDPFFQRNRVFGGAGYKINRNIVVLSGILHQFDYVPGRKTGKNFFQVNCFLEFNLKNSGSAKIPGAMD